MAKPEMVFKAGAVRASVFVNTVQHQGRMMPIRKVVTEVRYKDKTGEWQGTHSLSTNEVPKAMMVLQKAYEYLLEEGSRDWSGSTEGAGSTTSKASSLTDMSDVDGQGRTTRASVFGSVGASNRALGRHS